MKSKKLFVAFFIAMIVCSSASIATLHFGVAQSNNASQAQVLSYSWYTAPPNTYLAAEKGDLIVVGEIQNAGSAIINNASVEAIAYNSAGTVLARANGAVFVFHTIPGQKAPFYVDFTPASSSTGDLSWVSTVSSVTVSTTSVTDTSVAQYSKLAIPFGGSVGSLENNHTYTVVGYVNNTGTETVGDVWVVATFYDASGKVVALNFTSFLAESLAPNAEVAFWATPADNTFALSNEIANYTIQIDSLPIANSTPTSTPSSPTEQFPIIPVATVLVLVVGATIAFMLLKRRKLPPPPPPAA